MFTHIVLHNPQAVDGKGMEVYEISNPKKILDRALEIFDGAGFDHESKHYASKIIEGKFEDIFPKNRGYGNAIRELSLRSGQREKNVHLYLATFGKMT